MSATAVVHERRGLLGTLRDIYHERTRFDFIGRSRRWALLSGTLIVVSIGAIAIQGLNLGIDFEGGSQWEATVQKDTSISIDDVRTALAGTKAEDGKILVLTGSSGDSVRVQTDTLRPAEQVAVTKALADYAGAQEDDVSFVEVGPTWGDQITRKAVTALIFFFLLIAAYLTFQFEWRMALAAIIAVIHDIIITAGVYAITGFEVTPATIVAFLTILGFSLYDTVVVFDKIRENTPSLGAERGDTYSLMVNRSMNQVLMRSINTSFVALLPVASLLVVGAGLLGAVTLRDFALALFVGLLVGAYSSIFVATPLVAWFKEREPRYAALRERSAAQQARLAPSAPAPSGPADAPSLERDAGPEAAPTTSDEPPARPPTATPGAPITPRARRQRRRKRR